MSQKIEMVNTGDIAIGKYPVTVAQFREFVEDDWSNSEYWDGEIPEPPKLPEGKDNHPVTSVSYFDAIAYCKWLSKREGRVFRLPTDEEWLYAYVGDTGYQYPWGDEWKEGGGNVWQENSVKSTTPVGSYPDGISVCGAHDMAGNVWEWTSTPWSD
jgi:formylglycine-generating enzyme required for sulfatase activity